MFLALVNSCAKVVEEPWSTFQLIEDLQNWNKEQKGPRFLPFLYIL